MSFIRRIKPYLRWLVLGAALFFLFTTVRENWLAMAEVQTTPATWAGLVIALGVTLLAHIWSGWVWHWILQALDIQVGGLWTTAIYLKTNLAKYIPGNVWHFYGRVRALQAAGASLGGATVGVLLEPLLMAAGALVLVAVGSWQFLGGWPLLGLLFVLAGVHPYLLNPLLKRLSQSRLKGQPLGREQLQRYPIKAFLGELGFVLIRGLGFVITLAALQPLAPAQLLPVLGAFSAAWLLGLVVPGAPGGIGVFEAVAIALLNGQLPVGQILSGVLCYRLISTLAEAAGAGLVWLDQPTRNRTLQPYTPLLLPPGQPTPEDNSPPSEAEE
ncbi:MAG: YbhN family protein [Cyanobacteria bacterium J06554_6]